MTGIEYASWKARKRSKVENGTGPSVVIVDGLVQDISRHEVAAWTVVDEISRNSRSEALLWIAPFRGLSPLDAVSVRVSLSCITQRRISDPVGRPHI